MNYVGDFLEDATVRFTFNTFDSNDPSGSVTITNLADADLHVHKDGSTTEIVTDGATIAIDFDGITGNHQVTVDSSVHADYSTGSDYEVRMEGTTVDGGTINAFIGHFSIENRSSSLSATALTNLVAMYDGTGYAGGTTKLGVDLIQILGTTLTETAGLLAGGFKKLFNVASPTGTLNSLPDAVPGAAGGGFIAGTNAATVVTTSLTTTFTGNLTGSIGSLGATAKTDVNTEVDNALDTAIPGGPTAGSVNDVLKDLDALLPAAGPLSTFDETAAITPPGQEAPTVNQTAEQILAYLYKALRNRNTQTATTFSLYADDATTVDHKATVSDNGTTFDKGELGTGA